MPELELLLVMLARCLFQVWMVLGKIFNKKTLVVAGICLNSDGVTEPKLFISSEEIDTESTTQR